MRNEKFQAELIECLKQIDNIKYGGHLYDLEDVTNEILHIVKVLESLVLALAETNKESP